MIKLIKHGLRRYCGIVDGSIRAYGIFSFSSFKWIIILPIQIFIAHVCLLLDKVFFPKYKKLQLKEPIFIIGHPRSGTTLLHRLLAEFDNFVTFQYWETRFPALITRVIVKPIVNILVKLKKDVVVAKKTGHETRLTSVEEEDLLLLPLLDTVFIAFLSPLAYSKKVEKEGFDMLHDYQEHTSETMEFLKNCFKRQAYFKKGNRILAKIPFSCTRIQALHKAFPDAKYIYLVRNPLEAIPSCHSLVKKVQEQELIKPGMSEQWYDKWYKERNIDRSVFSRKFYEINISFYNHFYDSLEQDKILKEKVLEVNYNELTNDLENTIKKILIFAGINLSTETLIKIQSEQEKQKKYKRPHSVYSFADLNLSEDQIKSDLAPIFTRISEREKII
ncbi:MAG: sulfotransferase [Alphaproteobacteria bacterium]|nr:sulfotransferase [Alphaproteobacteria bacterium]